MSKHFIQEDPHVPVTLSVVCAVRNGAHCLDQLLQSYQRERTDDSELVILDGASTDATWDVVLQYRSVITQARSQSDRGIYDAWNQALPLCRGTHACFIGADDRLSPGSIRALAQACKDDAGVSHIVAGFNLLTRGGMPVALLGAPFDRGLLVRRFMLAQVMSAHRLDWLRSVQGFDASYRSSGDYELLLRCRDSLRVRVIGAVLAFMEDGGVSRTGLRPFLENYRARRRNGIAAWLSAALLAKALTGQALRRVGLR